MIDKVQKEVDSLEVKGSISDGYHTFDELYEFRKLYNAALFNEWAKMYYYNLEMKEKQGFNIDMEKVKESCYHVHKSWKHSNGELCFGGGWFIVMATLPSGQISNHYEAKDWDLFKVPERDVADKFDGHTSQDVLKRLKEL